MLKEMFKMQGTLNESTNGINWTKFITNKGKEIRWMRCFRLEGSEAIDQSTNWKHWKNVEGVEQYSFIGDTGEYNFKIENIDQWHFIMSEIIAQGWESEFNKDELFDIKIEKLNNKALVELVEEVDYLSYVYEKEVKVSKENGLKAMKTLMEQFVILTSNLMTLKELYEQYIIKNGLNFFRQENGYKEGTYIKEWGPNKIEDNLILKEYLNLGNEIKLDSIKDYLVKEYKRLNGVDLV